MDDSKIVELYFARCEQAVNATQMKYGIYCRSIAERILDQTEDADECVNDTWMQTWNSIPPNYPDNLRLYLGRITRNLALNRIRGQKTAKRGAGQTELILFELQDCVVDERTSAEKVLENKMISDSINTFLEQLIPEKRIAFVLRYWYCYSIMEIAEKMQLGEGKVKSILFRLRKQLKTHLEQEGISI